MKTFLAVIGGVLGFPLWMAAAGIWSAFVLTKLWFWFVVPYFHVQPLSLALAYGLIVLVGFVTRQYQYTGEDKRSGTEKLVSGLLLSTLSPALSLLAGWLAHLFLA